jgi:hypothetical protein
MILGQSLAGKNSERPGVEGEHPSSPGSTSPKTLDDQLESLNDQAERCRRLAGATYDRDVAAMLGSMADGYERTAKELSQKRPS